MFSKKMSYLSHNKENENLAIRKSREVRKTHWEFSWHFPLNNLYVFDLKKDERLKNIIPRMKKADAVTHKED